MPQYILPAYSIINHANTNYNHIDIFVKKQSVKVNMPAHWDIWFRALWWDCIGSPWDDPRWEDVAAPLTCRHWLWPLAECLHVHVIWTPTGSEPAVWNTSPTMRLFNHNICYWSWITNLLSLLLRLSWINSRNLYHHNCHAPLSLFTLHHSMRMCCSCLPVQS